jgi:hypothetical protein
MESLEMTWQPIPAGKDELWASKYPLMLGITYSERFERWIRSFAFSKRANPPKFELVGFVWRMATFLALVCCGRDGFHDCYELKVLGKERSVKERLAKEV